MYHVTPAPAPAAPAPASSDQEAQAAAPAQEILLARVVLTLYARCVFVCVCVFRMCYLCICDLAPGGPNPRCVFDTMVVGLALLLYRFHPSTHPCRPASPRPRPDPAPPPRISLL